MPNMATDDAVTLPTFWNTRTTAEFLCVPAETLRFWRHAGRGPRSFKLPDARRVLYDRDDVFGWVASARGSGPDAAA